MLRHVNLLSILLKMTTLKYAGMDSVKLCFASII